MLIKEIKDNTDGEIYHVIGLEEICIVNMIIFPRAIYRFNTIPIKLPMAFSYRIRTENFTTYMETQKTLNSQSTLEKEKELEESGSLTSDYTTKIW